LAYFTRACKAPHRHGQEPDDEEPWAGRCYPYDHPRVILGWPLIWFGFLVGVLLGGFFSTLIILWMVIRGGYKKNALMMFIPYGPYFITSAFMIVYFPRFVAILVPG
jgi:hypothetical protein